MSKASTARPARDRRAAAGRRALLLGAALALFTAAGAEAQQYGTAGSSVIVDYSVLDSLGTPARPNLPGMLATGQPQAMPYSGSPYAATPYGAQGGLQPPPATAPRSGLTMPGSAKVAGATTGGIQLIPPSEFKKKKATPTAAPATKPAQPAAQPVQPAPEPAQPAQPAAAPTPPPPPTPVEAPPAPAAVAAPQTPATPPAADAAATAEAAPPASAASQTPAPAQSGESRQAAAAPPPAPEAPPAPEPSPAPAAAPAPPPAPPPPEAPAAESADVAAADAPVTPPAESDVDDVPEAPDSEAMATADEPAEPPAEESQSAALPAPATVEGQVSVIFAEGASELTDESRAALDRVAERLRSDESLRVQLLAYAQAIDDNTSRARRMSLSRALAVRSYLIEKGVRSTRMDVRALGSNVEGEPPDRVDIIPQAQ